MVNLSYKQIVYLVAFPLIAAISIMLFIDFLGKYDKTIETLDFSKNDHFISKNGRIGYKELPPVTPNKEVFLHMNIANKHDYPLLVKPSLFLKVDDKLTKNRQFDEFDIAGKESDTKTYPFHVGPDGENEVKVTLGLWNLTNMLPLGNYSAATDFKVSPVGDELTSYSVWVAAIALGISAPVGFVTVYYSRKTQKSNEL